MATSSIAGVGDVERRDLAAAGLRAALSAGVLLAAYFLLPIGGHLQKHGLIRDVSAMLRLGAAVALFIVVLTLEIRAITKAKHPMVRAGVAMAVVIPLFLVFFAWTYLTMSAADPRTFAGAIGVDRMSALYFTVTVFSTVGFGDITPHTDLARLVVTLQMISDLVVLAVVVRLIFGAATRSTALRRDVGSADEAVAAVVTGGHPPSPG